MQTEPVSAAFSPFLSLTVCDCFMSRNVHYPKSPTSPIPPNLNHQSFDIVVSPFSSLTIPSPACLPEKIHPPKNVPSSELYPWTPPPPKPAASPAAYKPGKRSPLGFITLLSKLVSNPPNVFLVSRFILTAMSGPCFGSSSRCGGAMRLRLSGQ